MMKPGLGHLEDGEGNAMNEHLGHAAEGLGLLALGSSGSWEIAVDESTAREEWFLEIEGPRVYLVLRLQDLSIIGAVGRFLQQTLQRRQTPPAAVNHCKDAALPLGEFGSAPVTLMWDNEDFPRCFIVVGPQAQATLRVSLEEEDIRQVLDAFRQIAEELPEPASADPDRAMPG
jgi:hypothetical protein